MKVIDVQLRLMNLGYNPGPIDNIFGPRTRQALREFQRNTHIAATGQMDSTTISRLFGKVAASEHSSELPPWYEHARSFIGITEIKGKQSNSTIMGWAKNLGKAVTSVFNNDDIPWCGLFVAHIMSTNVPDQPIPSNPLGAQNWRHYGEAVEDPGLGDILVFWRGSPNSWQGHVGFYAGETADAYKVLGGNQNNQVNENTWISKNRLITARRPVGSLYKAPKLILNSTTGRLSTNEA